MKSLRIIFIVFGLWVLCGFGSDLVFAKGKSGSGGSSEKQESLPAFEETRRSPFIPQFPVKEEVVVVKPPPKKPDIVIDFSPKEPEKIFNVSAYRLEGVVWGAYAPRAIINNKIYGIGDIIDEAEITSINKEGVAVLFDKKEYLIRTKNLFVERDEEEVSDEIYKE